MSFVVALAACGPKSASGPIGHAGGAGGGASLSVTLAAADGDDGGGWTRTLAPGDGAHFPAVSADGSTIVDLVADAEDFSGIPIATVVFWTKAGVAASYRLVSQSTDEVAADQAQKEDAVVAQINAKLAESSWLPLDKVSATGESEDTGAPTTLTLGDGVTIALDQIADAFPAPGTASDEMGGGGCGEVTGLAEGFGSRAAGFAVVFPTVMLGGDDCFGSPSADLAIVVPIP